MRQIRRSPPFALLLLRVVVGLSIDWVSPLTIAGAWSFSSVRTVTFGSRVSLDKSVHPYPLYPHHKARLIALNVATSEEETDEDNSGSTAPNNSVPPEDDAPDPTSMRVRELKAQLEEWNVKFDDCFDKESLVARYKEVLNDPSRRTAKTDASTVDSVDVPSNSVSDSIQSIDDEEEEEDELDPTEILQELRSMTVKELRTELGERRISRVGLLEKEDLVQALLAARLRPVQFSITGLLQPGMVADVTGEQLREEMQPSTVPPLLVDVYATWCGPCQIMAKQLEEAAHEFGSTLRIAKLDSDRHSTVASQLRVQGLPTLILVDGVTGREIDRLEGALMKEQLIQWIRSRL